MSYPYVPALAPGPLAGAEVPRAAMVPGSGAHTSLTAGSWWLVALLGVGVLSLLSLWLRPLLPVDETRYIGVAWEMWQRGDFLVPHLNGAFYDHKPPALFWLIHAGWWVAGVGEAWPRMIGPLSTLASVWLLSRLGAALWPDRPGIGRLGSLMFLATIFVAFYQTTLMFDMPLLATVAWAWWALVSAARSGQRRHWLAFAAAVGLGLLVKGPVALVYTLPAALTLRWWRPTGSTPSPRFVFAWVAAVALAVPGAWLAAAWYQGSGAYFGHLLIDQTVQRVTGQMGHPRPWYWYAPVVLLLAMPWTLWFPAWRALWRSLRQPAQRQDRLLAISIGAGLLILSLVGGKQVHYLIPLLALLMLAIARGLDNAAGRWRQAQRIVVASLLVCAVTMAVVLPRVSDYVDLAQTSAYLGRQQQAGRVVAYVGNYQGEFGFLGRLTRPVLELTPAQANAWLRETPDGVVVARAKRLHLRGAPRPEHSQRYKTDELMVFSTGELRRTGSTLQEPAGKDD